MAQCAAASLVFRFFLVKGEKENPDTTGYAIQKLQAKEMLNKKNFTKKKFEIDLANARKNLKTNKVAACYTIRKKMFETQLHLHLQDPKVQVQRMEKASESYKELEAQGILPPWPGPGYLFRTVYAPACTQE